MADFRAILQKTADIFVENNTLAVKRRDASLFSAILTDDCVRIYRPLSFLERYHQFFKKEITNADYEAHMGIELQTMQEVSQKVTRSSIDTTQRRATLWTEQTITTTDQSKKVVEMIWDLEFTEDGTRVKQILEFVDSYESSQLLEEMLTKADAH
ncbi:putative SnoaL-like domain-containing protein [Seiridium cardinale]